jgi:ketosteroid isomerase-like protein
MKSTICAALVAFLANSSAVAADNPTVTAEIIALAKAQTDAAVTGKAVSEQMSAMADDFTLFNSIWATRLENKAAVFGFNTADEQSGGRVLHTEILNPRVQTYGETAILTYNRARSSLRKNGTISNENSKVTRVYVKIDGRWRNVHAHLSPAGQPAN